MSFLNPESVQQDRVSSPRSIIVANRIGALPDEFIVQSEEYFKQKYSNQNQAQNAHAIHKQQKDRLLQRATKEFDKLSETFITEQEYKSVGMPQELRYLLKFPVSSPQMMKSSMLKLSNNDMNLALKLRREKEQQEQEKLYNKQRQQKLDEIEKKREEAKIQREEELKEKRDKEIEKRKQIEKKNQEFLAQKERERQKQRQLQAENDKRYKEMKLEREAQLKQEQDEVNEKLQQKRDLIAQKQNQLYLNKYQRFQENMSNEELKLLKIRQQQELDMELLAVQNQQRAELAQIRLDNVKEQRAQALYEMSLSFQELEQRHVQQLDEVNLKYQERMDAINLALLEKTNNAHKKYDANEKEIQMKGQQITQSYIQRQQKFETYKMSQSSNFEQALFERKLKAEEAKLNAERARRACEYKAQLTDSKLNEKFQFVEEVVGERNRICNENQQLCIRMSAIKGAPPKERAKLEQMFLGSHVEDDFEDQLNRMQYDLSQPSGRPASARAGNYSSSQMLAESTLSDMNQPTFTQRHTKAEYDSLTRDITKKRAMERQLLLDAALREQEEEARRKRELQNCTNSELKIQMKHRHAEERKIAYKQLSDMRSRQEWEIQQVQNTVSRRFGATV